jgi:hypothetical protein
MKFAVKPVFSTTFLLLQEAFHADPLFSMTFPLRSFIFKVATVVVPKDR